MSEPDANAPREDGASVAPGETSMVLGTGRERPLSIGLHTDGDPEARFESASLHQFHCARCDDWARMGLSSSCPSCDAAMLEALGLS